MTSTLHPNTTRAICSSINHLPRLPRNMDISASSSQNGINSNIFHHQTHFAKHVGEGQVSGPGFRAHVRFQKKQNYEPCGRFGCEMAVDPAQYLRSPPKAIQLCSSAPTAPAEEALFPLTGMELKS